MIKKIKQYFQNKKKQKEILIAENILSSINDNRGLIWENIAVFIKKLQTSPIGVNRGTPEGDKLFPLKHHFADGLYTREIFMPKGSIIASLIHKTNHPSFLLKGEVSILADDGTVKRIKAPLKNNDRGRHTTSFIYAL